jgi:hypothetical protein
MAEPIEYAGYQATKPIDWASLTGDLTDRYNAIKAQRQKERESLDALVDVNNKILQTTQLGKSPSSNEFILKGTETGRSKMNEWNKLLKSGEISPSEYKRRMSNLMDSWNQFAITTKTYDERMQEILKNQQPDENGEIKGSALELERANELAQYQDLKNKAFMIDDETGKSFLGKLKDGVLDPTSVTDVRSLNNFQNIIDNKIQLNKLVDSGTKNWKSFKIENGVRTVDDIRQNKDAYAKAKSTLINGILSNDNSKASVLTDYTNDEYDYYLNNDDFLSRVQKRVEAENYARELNNKPPMNEGELNNFIDSQRSKFILLQHDDQGILQPVLTKEQDKAAFDIVDNEIEIRMGKEETMDEPYRGGGRVGGAEDEIKQTSGIPERVYGAWDNVESLGSAESQRIMSQASGGQYSFKWEKEDEVGGINVYKKNSKGELEKQNLTIITNPKYLSKYFGYSPDKWTKEGKRGVGQAKTYSSAQEANIKATLKDNPGATRQQAIKALGYE